MFALYQITSRFNGSMHILFAYGIAIFSGVYTYIHIYWHKSGAKNIINHLSLCFQTKTSPMQIKVQKHTKTICASFSWPNERMATLLPGAASNDNKNTSNIRDINTNESESQYKERFG